MDSISLLFFIKYLVSPSLVFHSIFEMIFFSFQHHQPPLLKKIVHVEDSYQYLATMDKNYEKEVISDASVDDNMNTEIPSLSHRH